MREKQDRLHANVRERTFRRNNVEELPALAHSVETNYHCDVCDSEGRASIFSDNTADKVRPGTSASLAEDLGKRRTKHCHDAHRTSVPMCMLGTGSEV
jgi:hypothetical protein